MTVNTIYNDQVITVFPCNFNSKYRKEGYLFRKLVLAVLENQKSEIGNLDFLREMSHAKYISKRLVEVQESGIISPGLRINVRQYFADVLKHFGKKYEDYFNESIVVPKKDQSYLNNIYTDYDPNYTYDDLVRETIEDFEESM